MGIMEDCNMTSNQYTWLGCILWFGYLAGEFIVNFLQQKFHFGKFVGINVIIWGVFTAAVAGMHSFSSLAAMRFVMGLFEATVMPSFIQMTQMWYTRDEQLLIVAIWSCMPGVQTAVGGLIAYGVMHYKGNVLYNWQLLFLILGVITVVLGFVIFLFLPSSPVTATCFDEETRAIMVARVRKNFTGARLNKTIKWYQIKEGVMDITLWCYVGMQLISCFFVGGLSYFSNLIVAQFGYTYLQTQLLNIAQGSIIVIIMIGTMFTAQKTKQRLLTLLAIAWIPLVGLIIVMKITPTHSNRVGLLIAYYLTEFTWPIGDMINATLSQNISGSSKRSATFTFNYAAWALGNAIAPLAFMNGSKDHYHTAFTVDIILFCIYYALLITTRILLSLKNKKKIQNAPRDELGNELTDESTAFDDLTDKENPYFRYTM